MNNYITQNKSAWEFNAYEFWSRDCSPIDRAKADRDNPIKQLKKYARYFDTYEGIRVANICGSSGKKAIPLAVLGAKVTVFDISEDNKRYAMEVAEAANVKIDYQVGNVLEIDMDQYGQFFDVVFMEGGILHYFHDIDQFMKLMNALLKPNGTMICSDFHPFTKIVDALGAEQQTMSYFSTEVFEGEMAHARFFDEEIRAKMPLCSYRKYTLSEIMNATIQNGFLVQRFDEHPSWANPNLPGEFTIVSTKA